MRRAARESAALPGCLATPNLRGYIASFSVNRLTSTGQAGSEDGGASPQAASRARSDRPGPADAASKRNEMCERACASCRRECPADERRVLAAEGAARRRATRRPRLRARRANRPNHARRRGLWLNAPRARSPFPARAPRSPLPMVTAAACCRFADRSQTLCLRRTMFPRV